MIVIVITVTVNVVITMCGVDVDVGINKVACDVYCVVDSWCCNKSSLAPGIAS